MNGWQYFFGMIVLIVSCSRLGDIREEVKKINKKLKDKHD